MLRGLTVAESYRLIADSLFSVFQPAPYILQRRPPRIFHFGGAGTLFLIQIFAALGTQSFAVFAARNLQRERQQHLLTQYIFEQQPITLIVTDLGFSIRN
jgi:hypothetical protein